MELTPQALAVALGVAPPTDEQAAVISAHARPTLVVSDRGERGGAVVGPHQLAHIDTAGLSTGRPIAVLIELCRSLDIHPADLGADARGLLTALAHARAPLSVEDLARALGWPLGRVEGALGYAHQHPDTAGPMMLRRVLPETFTLVTFLIKPDEGLQATGHGMTCRPGR